MTLFGTNGVLNDLWEFNPSTKAWTWVSGSTLANVQGAYGTKGIASTSNVPGARAYVISWADGDGNFWLFGGVDFSGGLLNDLWEYSPSAKTWTWVSGSNTENARSVYGTRGIAAASNVPGARGWSASWIDASGNLWLFGGNGYDAGSGGFLNDLWKYSPTANTWTWMDGSNVAEEYGLYGTQGTGATGNVPGARANSVSWNDANGNYWLFGGAGDAASEPGGGELNDLWRYQP